MGADVLIGEVPEWDASAVTVTEDATPIDPSDNFGGVGSIEFTIPVSDRSKSLLNEPVTLTDGERGTTQGVVRALAGPSRVNVDVAALTRLSVLVADRTADPHIGTLESCLMYYFGLCGLTTGIVIDETVGATEVVTIGWYGEVWEHIKKLGAAYQFQVIPVGADIVVRPLRTITVSNLWDETAFSWSLDESRLAQQVDAWYYPVSPITDALVVGNELSPVSNIGQGQVVEFDVDLGASLSSVVQPVCVSSVAYDVTDASVYSVLDEFDEPVSPADWADGGGRILVEIGEDTRTLHVTVVGSQNHYRAPYRLAGMARGGTEYSTLRVIGTGVAFTRAKYTLPASLDERATTIIGAEVDNEFFTSWGHAHICMLPAVRRHGVVSQRISGSAYTLETPEQLAGQTFGNVAGARIFEDLNVYRVRTATITPTEVAYEAEADLTFADVDAVNDGFEIADWDALWEGRPISEYDLRPLTPLGDAVTPPTGGLYPGSLTYPSSTTFPGA